MRERSADAARAAGLCAHGNFPSNCEACAKEREKAPVHEGETRELTRERLKELSTLAIEVKSDLGPVLDALNRRLGTRMQHRESGFHVTVIGPTEAKALEGLSDAQLDELRRINDGIAKGEGIEVAGIGVIDGTVADVPEKDRKKRTSYLAIKVPALDAFRRTVGLPDKDLHVTLGFEGGDIHMALTGEKDAKGKDVLAPIEKKADPSYGDLLADVRVEFAGLTGKEKEKKQEKPADPEKEAKKKVQAILAESGLGGKDLIALGLKPGPEMGKAVAAIEKAVREGGSPELDLPADARSAIEERIVAVRKKLGSEA